LNGFVGLLPIVNFLQKVNVNNTRLFTPGQSNISQVLYGNCELKTSRWQFKSQSAFLRAEVFSFKSNYWLAPLVKLNYC